MNQKLLLFTFFLTLMPTFATTAESDPKKLEQLFFESAKKGNLNELEKCLNDGIKIDITDEQDNTALHYAAENGQVEIIDRLFKGQEDPGFFYSDIIRISIDAKNVDGDTPLQKATAYGHENAVKKLLEGYVDKGILFSSTIKATINTYNKKNDTPIHAAAAVGNNTMLHYFLTGQTNEGIFYNDIDKGNVNAKNDNGEQPIHMIARHITPATLTLLVEHGANVEAEDNAGQKLLERAARSGNVALVDNLVNKFGAHYMTKDGEKSSVLHIAFEINNINLAKIFALNKQLLNTRNEKGLTPLAISVNKQEMPLIQFALQHGADATIKDFQQKTALHTATQKNNLPITELLLKSGFDHLINARDYLGKTAFRYATEHSNIPMMDALRSYKASVDSKDNDGNTELHYGASTDNVALCKYLLSIGADPELRNKKGRNTFDIILDKSNDINDNLFSLIKSHKNFNINATDSYGKNALMRSIAANNLAKVRLHISSGADVCFTDSYGNTSLHTAAEHGNKEIINEIIKTDPRVLHICNTSKQTPLITALKHKQQSAAYNFLEAGADKNVIDINGLTPLDHALRNNLFYIAQELVTPQVIEYINENKRWTFHRALKQNAHALVKQMIAAHVDIHMADEDGDTPIYTATQYNNQTDAELLIKHGANPNTCNKKGTTPLMLTAINNNLNFATMLLSNQAAINFFDNRNFTALTHATAHAHIEMMKFFIQQGASITTRDCYDNTLLHIASETGNQKSLSLLSSVGLSAQSKNYNNETPLDHGIRKNQLSSVQFFIDQMPPLSLQLLDLFIARARWHSSNDVLRYVINIKNKNVHECEQIIQAQAQLQTTAKANEKKAATIEKKKGSYSSSYREANCAATYTIDYLMTKTSSEKESLLRAIKEQCVYETREQNRLETVLQKIQIDAEQAQRECTHVINLQDTLRSLRYNNEQLNGKIEAIVKKLPNQSVTTYRPCPPAVECSTHTLTHMNPQDRKSFLETLLQSQKHEVSEKERLAQLLCTLEKMEHERYLQEEKNRQKREEEEKQAERERAHKLQEQENRQKVQEGKEQCPACQKVHTSDHFIQIKDNDDRRMPCKQCLKQHTKNNATYVPHICKICFHKNKDNDHNTCSYCKKSR